MSKIKNLIVLKLAGVILLALRVCFGDGIFRNKLD